MPELPSNIEAEQAILAAILIDNDVFYTVSDWLLEEHFFDPLHGRIFAAIARLVRSRRRATPISLRMDFEDEEPIGDLSVPQYLGQLAAQAPPTTHGWEYGRTVYDMAQRRRLADIGQELIDQAMSAPIETSPDTLVEQAEVSLASIAEKGKANDHLVRMSDATIDALNTVAAAYQRDGKMAGHSSGLRDLDSLIGGFASSLFYVIAARPGMGKTALATKAAYLNARRFVETDGEDGCPAGFFSCEMSAREVMFRLLGMESGISSDRLRRGDITQADYERMCEIAGEKFGPTPLYFDEAGGISIAQLCARARRMKRRHGIGVLVVDYIQLLSGTRRKDGRNAEVTEITNSLKALAKELEIPVLALSQLSRDCERREDKRPQLHDLRDSGSIEQDADAVIFLYRDEYYVAQRQPKKDSASYFEWLNELSRIKNKCELLVPKQRQGPTGVVEVRFDAELTKFDDLAIQEHLPMEVA